MKTICKLFLGAVALGILGCGGSGSSNSTGGGPGGGSGSGTLAIAMADAPLTGVTAVDVTIPRVEANINGQWQIIASPNETYNLLTLAKNDTLLGQSSIPSGTYSQIRLFVSSASITDATGTHTVTVPSGAQTGLKLNVDFTITPNQVTTILIDFNAAESIHVTGNGKYMLQPVIPATVQILSGTITGVATNGTTPLNGATISAKYTAGTSYTVGTVVNTTTSTSDGSFKVWALLPGTYELDLSYTTSSNTTITAVVSNVNVSADQNTDVGSVTLH